MDTLWGLDVANDRDDVDHSEDAAIDAPLMVVSDERRMQVRAYNYWASLLGDRALPSIEDLAPEELDDFGPYSILLDFSTGLENPRSSILAPRCGRNARSKDRSPISTTCPPARSCRG